MSRSPATTETCIPSGRGTLSKLCREARDEIYRYLVKGKYRVMGTNITAISYYEPHSTILRVSKHISDEAMSIFYSESTFHLYLYVCSPKTLTDRMMRIHYHILGVGDSFSSHKNAESLQPSNWTNPENMKAICDNTIG